MEQCCFLVLLFSIPFHLSFSKRQIKRHAAAPSGDVLRDFQEELEESQSAEDTCFAQDLITSFAFHDIWQDDSPLPSAQVNHLFTVMFKCL
jgi:hypothetical protein